MFAISGVLRTQKLKPGAGPNIATHPALLISTLTVHSPAFFPNPPEFFLC